MIARLLAAATRRQRRATALAIVLAMAGAVAGVALLAVAGWFLAAAALAGAGSIAAAQAFNYLLPSAAIRGLAIARTAGRYGERLLSHRAALLALADLRPALFARLAGADPVQALDRPAGAVAAQLGSDVDRLEDRVVRKVALPAALAAVLAGLALVALAQPGAALALLAGLAAMRITARVLARRWLVPAAQVQAAALARLKAAYADAAAGAAEIAVWQLGPRVCADLGDLAGAVDAARLAAVRAEARIGMVQQALAGLTIAAVLALAMTMHSAPLAGLAVLAAAGAAEAWATLARADLPAIQAAEALDRLAAIAALPPRATDAGEAAEPRPATLELRLSRAVVALPPGGRVLVAGPSGSGKSRLLGTLIGLRGDAPETLLVDGVDVRALGLNRLRRQFALAPQDAGLIAGTVADNLRLARPRVTEAAMWQALDLACMAETVRAMPGGLDEWLGGDGARLSGGQRKRLALARAVLAGRPWLLLDEPTEGLDAATEAMVIARLEHWLASTGTGLVLVSHRPAPQRLARQVATIGG